MSDILRDVVLPKLEGVRQSGGSFSARCPAHEDRNPSLSITVGKEHPVVFHCQAGCHRDDILTALGLTWAEVCKPREDDQHGHDEWTPRGAAVAVYDYRDEAGSVLFQVCRTADKQFPQRRPDRTTKSGWSWKLGDVRRVLYRLPKVIEAVRDGKVIYICEGERDVHTLEAEHLIATCNPGGAGKFRQEFAEFLRDATVTIIADKDKPGQAHARQVAAMLDGIAGHIRIVEPAVGKDATDHFSAGHRLSQLVRTWTSDEPAKVDLAVDLWEFIATGDPDPEWVVPGLLERGDRLVWTGFEGLGKSMFIRQLAVCAAAGIHPFNWGTADQYEPRRVLLIDAENSERQSRRKFRPLAAASIKAHRRVPDGGLRLIHRPEGIDLSREADAAWLLERVTAHKPDLLIIGPFYRLHMGDMNDERVARKVVGVLDAARVKADCALVIEAHAGHGEAGKNRSVRPVGSSLLLRWPEFGYGIAPAEDPQPGKACRDVHVKPWRGARDERSWPTRLTWGDPNGWPWQTVPETP